MVGSGPLEAGTTQTRCDIEAGTELGGTRGPGTESVRSGGRNLSPIPNSARSRRW